MPPRITALFTVAAFVLFTASCSFWPAREIRTEADYPSQTRRILTVVKTNGEVVEFSKKDPGRVLGDEIRGTARVLVNEKTEIEGPFPQIKRRADGTIAEVTDVKGKIHYVRTVLREEPDRLVVQERYSAQLPIAIPLSDVRLVTYKKANVVLTLAAIAVLGALGVVALAAYSLAHE
jgi:hypothetical protein